MVKNEVLHELAEGFSIPLIGTDFFSYLCKSLIKILKVDYACISRVTKGGKFARPLSFFSKDGAMPNEEYAIEGTPCQQVIEEEMFLHFSADIQKTFPDDEYLKTQGLESYSGIPIFNRNQEVMGLIVVMSSKHYYSEEHVENVFKIVFKRVELELERLLYEETLQLKVMQLNDAQRLASVGSFEWDKGTNTLNWSDELYRIFGYAPGELTISLDVYLGHIHADSVKLVKESIENLLLGKERAFDHEYNVITKKNEERTLRTIGKVIENDIGEITGIFGACHDITAVKSSEQKLMVFNAALEAEVKKRTEGLQQSLHRERLVHEISDITIEYLNDSNQMVDLIAEKTGQFLGADGVIIFRHGKCDESDSCLIGEYGLGNRIVKEDLVSLIIAERSKTSVVKKDLSYKEKFMVRFSSTGMKRLENLGIQSIMAIDIVHMDKNYGFIFVYQVDGSKVWDNEEKQLVHEIQNHLGGAFFKMEILEKREQALKDVMAVRKQLKLITDIIPAFISYLDDQLIFRYVNKTYADFFQISENSILGTPAQEILGETFSMSKYYLDRALQGESVTYENTIKNSHNEVWEVEVRAIPDIKDHKVAGVVILGTNVTRRKAVERRLLESEKRLRLALNSTGLGTWDYDLHTKELMWDSGCRKMFGLSSSAKVDYNVFLKGLHPDDRDRIDKKVNEAISPGKNGFYNVEYRTLGIEDGIERWVRATGQAFFNSKGVATRFIGTIQNITNRKNADFALKATQKSLEKKNKMLSTLSHLGQIISSELEHKKVVQTITDAGRVLTGAKFGAFFYNGVSQNGELYMLYTLSGIPISTFDKFPAPRKTKIFAPTFNGERIVRYDDVLQEPDFGQNPPFQGMPKGHPPVRSYLAAPVISRSGETVGGLFFGHPDPGVFSSDTEKAIKELLPHASIALENAKLYEQSQRATKMFEDQRNILYNIFESSPYLISMCKGKHLVYEYVNKTYQSVFLDKLIGTSLKDRLSRTGHEHLIPVFESVFETGQQAEVKEVPFTVDDGSGEKVIYLNYIIQATRNEKDAVDGIIKYAANITEQVMARKTIEDFMSVASHELKTPLTTIMAYGELLEECSSMQNGDELLYIKKMNTNIHKLNGLIADFLDVSRIQGGKMTFRKEPIDIIPFLFECVENVQQTIKSHRIVVLTCSTVFVFGDKQRLEQALINIINNAVKYSPRADTVIIDLAVKVGILTISVTDFGMGIPEDAIEHLFERFYRIEEQGVSGLGMGLYITKEIVERHQGCITVKSRKGKGSTFVISLPIIKDI